MQTDDEDVVVHLVLPRSLRREIKRVAAEADSTIREVARRALTGYVDHLRRSHQAEGAHQ